MHLEEIEEAVSHVVVGGWYLKGEETCGFEEAYARYIGTKHCVACGNGLDALTLIFRAYKERGVLHDGDEVLVPANTYIASILSITENNLKPVPVEPWVSTLELNETLLEEAVTEKTRALLLVHLYGRNAMTPGIRAFCDRHHLLLIEDNAQAAGTFAENPTDDDSKPLVAMGEASVQLRRRTGNLGNAAAHSFYPTKNLGALGDAGAVTTDDAALADMVRTLGNYGSSEKYVFPYKGKNSRVDEIQAAVLRVKLKYLDQENDRRREIARYYYDNIHNADLFLPQDVSADCNYHIFPVLCHHRDQLQAFLKEQGIGTMIHYPIPPHQQGAYKEWASLSLSVTEKIHRAELSIPCNQTMTDAEVETVASTINTFHISR